MHVFLLQPVFTKQVAINVVAPLGPGVDNLSRDLNEFITEPAPEAWITVPTQSALLLQFINLLAVLFIVMIDEMPLEELSTRQHFVATRNITVPGFKLEMLTALMSFPVILAAKLLATRFVGTPIGLVMPFHMLSKILYELCVHGKDNEIGCEMVLPKFAHSRKSFAALWTDYLCFLVFPWITRIIIPAC